MPGCMMENRHPPRQDPRQTNTTFRNGIQTLFSALSNLGKFLPTGTNLVFGALIIPVVYDNSGQCSTFNKIIMGLVLGCASLFCIYLSFTDSVEIPDEQGRETTTILYGFVHPTGLWVPNDRVIGENRYRLGRGDWFHAVMSGLVFLFVALSDHRVTHCFSPTNLNMERTMRTLMLYVGAICSSLCLSFPIHRRGTVPTQPQENI